MRTTTLVVLAKSPAAGRSKTRLCPPYSPQQAAELAEAALCDTLAAVLATASARPVLALDGEPGRWLPTGLTVLRQRGDGLAERIAAAMQDALHLLGGPVLLIGMDTPQVTPELLETACRRLACGEAALGLAEDGGFWALGLHAPSYDLLRGVPMSTGHTGPVQRSRLVSAGLLLRDLPALRDVDTAADADHVAALAPESRFARVHGTLAASR